MIGIGCLRTLCTLTCDLHDLLHDATLSPGVLSSVSHVFFGQLLQIRCREEDPSLQRGDLSILFVLDCFSILGYYLEVVDDKKGGRTDILCDAETITIGGVVLQMKLLV